MGYADPDKILTDQFLRRCPTCGALRGEIALDGSESPAHLACRCESGHCPRCRRPLLSTPFSHSYDEIEGKTWHASQIGTRCPSCGPLHFAPPGGQGSAKA